MTRCLMSGRMQIVGKWKAQGKREKSFPFDGAEIVSLSSSLSFLLRSGEDHG